MVAAMTQEDFGSCTNHGECEAVCPKHIPLEFIAALNRDLIRAAFRRHREPLVVIGTPREQRMRIRSRLATLRRSVIVTLLRSVANRTLTTDYVSGDKSWP